MKVYIAKHLVQDLRDCWYYDEFMLFKSEKERAEQFSEEGSEDEWEFDEMEV